MLILPPVTKDEGKKDNTTMIMFLELILKVTSSLNPIVGESPIVNRDFK